MQDVGQAVDVEEGFLLAGERGVRQVLGGGGGAHGKGDALVGVPDQAMVVVGDFLVQLILERGFHDPLADLAAAIGQRAQVFDVQLVECGVDALRQAILRQEVAVGIGRGGKAAGHAHPGLGQVLDHFAEGGVLAAHAGDIGDAELFEGKDVLGHGKNSWI
ncbi:hypothetical protein GALL_428950 [mine drainage metagenome]|uniref:Uncharacterized protein n=1 Tax=mine drainage metagenome TaxID=410659 RepID=A0A1J5Q617_9ZZZZ